MSVLIHLPFNPVLAFSQFSSHDFRNFRSHFDRCLCMEEKYPKPSGQDILDGQRHFVPGCPNDLCSNMIEVVMEFFLPGRIAVCQQFYPRCVATVNRRSEEHTSELQSLMRISYAVFCLKKKKKLRDETQT